MELLGIAAVAVLAYIIFIGVKFTTFKSKLMNEFGRRGVSFRNADDLFFASEVKSTTCIIPECQSTKSLIAI